MIPFAAFPSGSKIQWRASDAFSCTVSFVFSYPEPFSKLFFSYLPLHDIGILKNSGQLFWLTSSNVSKTLTLCTYTGLWGEEADSIPALREGDIEVNVSVAGAVEQRCSGPAGRAEQGVSRRRSGKDSRGKQCLIGIPSSEGRACLVQVRGSSCWSPKTRRY